MLMHMPFLGAGIVFKENENKEAVKYQAAHYELLASAQAVKMAKNDAKGKDWMHACSGTVLSIYL